MNECKYQHHVSHTKELSLKSCCSLTPLSALLPSMTRLLRTWATLSSFPFSCRSGSQPHTAPGCPGHPLARDISPTLIPCHLLWPQPAPGVSTTDTHTPPHTSFISPDPRLPPVPRDPVLEQLSCSDTQCLGSLIFFMLMKVARCFVFDSYGPYIWHKIHTALLTT